MFQEQRVSSSSSSCERSEQAMAHSQNLSQILRVTLCLFGYLPAGAERVHAAVSLTPCS